MDKFENKPHQFTNPSPQSHGAALSQPALMPAQLQPGQMIDARYKVIAVIASGGFGCVYKVRDVLLKKTFALKMLHPIAVSDKTMLRLRKEAQAAAMLDHPNLVGGVNFGFVDHRQPYLVMEFLEGPTLAQYLKEHTRIPWESALQIFIPVCYAMAYAHDQGVIHRDIKPSNIILTGNLGPEHRNFIPKMVDFGIAKLQSTNESQALTKTGDIFGTPLYMSPEQCAGAGVDSRSDIYALGCVLFETLTGAPPFQGNTALETMMQHAAKKAPSLQEASLGLQFPDALEKLVTKMMAKDSRDRYQSLMEVGHDLLSLQEGDVDRMRVIAVPVRSIDVDQPKRMDWSVFFLGCIAGLIVGGVLVLAYSIDQQNKGKAIADITKAENTRSSKLYEASEVVRKDPKNMEDEIPKLFQPSVEGAAERSERLGHLAQAESLYTQKLKNDEKALSPTDPHIVEDLHHLAACDEKEGKQVEAEPLFKRAITIREKTEPNSSGLADCYSGLADCYVQEKKYAQAEALYKQALAMHDKTKDPNGSHTIEALHQLARCYELEGKQVEAEPLLRRAITIREKAEPSSPLLADCYCALADCYALEKKYAQAEVLCKQAVAMYEKTLSPDNPKVVNCKIALARNHNEALEVRR